MMPPARISRKPGGFSPASRGFKNTSEIKGLPRPSCRLLHAVLLPLPAQWNPGSRDFSQGFIFIASPVANDGLPAHSESKSVVPVCRPPSRAGWCFKTQFQTWKRSLFMNLTISGHHLEVTPALRGYVTSKLDRITRHFDQVVDVKVLLTVDNMKEKERRQRAECNVHVKGRDLFAESSHADLYAAVDELTDKLDRQVGRYKTRTQDHHHVAAKRQA
jgi:putative sigma-54 modulation protein